MQIRGRPAGHFTAHICPLSSTEPATIMEEAVSIANAITESGDIVSLSPASASFDSYADFEARGNHFKQLVQALQ